MLRHLLRLPLCAIGITLLAGPALAQLPSNASLKGVYNVRFLGADATGPADRPLSFSGTITFDGASDTNGFGGFTVSGQGASTATTDKSLRFLTSGQYGVLSNGMFFMTNPFDAASSTSFASAATVLYGGIGANGVAVASSTDTGFCDLIVAIPVATSASAATLSGNYWVAHMEYLGGDTSQTRDTFFSMTASGSGNLGNVTIKGTAQNLNSAATTQTSTGATYTVPSANGTGTMVFPAASGVAAGNMLLSGNKVLYVSQDGSFFIAGGSTAYDMIIGVKAVTGNPATAATGLYFTAFYENYAVGSQADGSYGLQGASNILSTGVEIGHQRTNYDGFFSYDFSFDRNFTFAADGTFVDPTFEQDAVGAGGAFIIGAGASTNYQLGLYVKAPTLTGTGVFLNPQGVVNAANNVPFTAGVAPGEVISLYGTNLASSTATTPGLPFPNTLAGASVTVNGTPAPIYYASPTLISAVVPYSVTGVLLDIVVTNGGTASNTVTVYRGDTSPGIFTVPSGGVGNGAILHLDYTLVSTSSPAAVGETVQIYLTGMGTVTPAVKEGAAASGTVLSNTDQLPDVYIDGLQVLPKVGFSGLAPTLGGLYQLNVTIPTGVTPASNVTIEIVTNDADNIQATIPIK